MDVTRRMILGVMLALVGPGCWAADAASVPAAPAQAHPPAVAMPAADEASLKGRVLDRWQALIKRDFESAYLFETPAYRAIFNPRQFQLQYGGQVDWRVANVKSIDYDSPNVARVGVEITSRSVDPNRNGEVSDITQQVKETWLRKDGQWWHQRD